MNTLILIIEDNPDNFYLMRYLLENEDYKVIGADSGWLGIEMALYNNPDIILLDIQLPGMDGYEVARKLRENESLAGIPIVAVTSYAMVGDKEQALAAGATGYIEKPINPYTFASEIKHFIPKKDKGDHDEDPDRG
ncbi:MAG TPA: response regulator [Candidatus Cloacimonadota bacterium]|nr:response regulator [Candidatus Cloacimonadota bacterium]